ncbi:MAG: ABC transporter substrate binding protein [Pseudomonadota bacterium]
MASKPPFRILHVMSYHSPWRWTDGQFAGFKAGLGDVPAEFKVVQLDTKHRSGEEQKAENGLKARALVDAWKPHLIYTTDDDAQELVTRHYLNTPIKLVFSGVNKAPEVYGFDKADNVSGVIEHEHFAESVSLLKRMVPGMERLVVVLDDAGMWEPVMARMKASPLPAGVRVVGWETIKTYSEFKKRVAHYPQIADAIALIGIFNFKDDHGRNVPYQEVLKWTAENSSLPDLGFWIDRVHFGTLAAVTVSEREQGLAAGRIARAVLVGGKAPRTLPMRPTSKGLPVINLARAHKLGIQVRSELLLSAEVVTRFDWDK